MTDKPTKGLGDETDDEELQDTKKNNLVKHLVSS